MTAPLSFDAWADGADLAAAVLGEGLPPAAEDHLRRAGLAYADAATAEWHLGEAAMSAPDHVAVLIAYYRYYFYKGRLAEALQTARVCLAKAAEDIGLHGDWRRVRRQDARFDSFDAILPRFYMFVLKGYAYLNLRLGRLDEGRDAAEKLLELDPSDKIGAGLLIEVLDRAEAFDQDG